MKKAVLTLLVALAIGPASVWADGSPTEGTITSRFVPEAEMMAQLMQMLADFMPYVKAQWQPCVEPNAVGDACGCFRGEDTMAANERGVRPNADLSMVCAFLYKYGRGDVALPTGVTWDEIALMARQSLVFAYSTHKANRLKPCRGGHYWGSVSEADHQWESSLWALSVAFSAFFQKETLDDDAWTCVYNLLKAECDYELERPIPTGFRGDTKAEENGWETNVLACALGLFPDDALAPRWFDRLRAFAVNAYSHSSDAADHTVIDPDRDGVTVADLYAGANLYDDFTLQNHNYFHTSYQNVVMQELGESIVALRLFGSPWQTDALLHHQRDVMDRVLADLALADGELAMPNGNDWSLFLYDQVTSYSSAACFLRHADALMLEDMAVKYIRARQQTTADGSWLLRPDVGTRRMGVQAHRVMMTWLMHHLASTADLQPTRWGDFRAAHAEARLFASQQIVRAYTPRRFSCFSWSDGLKSYTGYLTSDSPDRNKIIIPFRAHNTGNLLGWYEVEGRRTNARPLAPPDIRLDGTGWMLRGALSTNDDALTRRFTIVSTDADAVILIDSVFANADAVITAERSGVLAISYDPFTRTERTVRCGTGWMNIDDAVTVVTDGPQPVLGDSTAYMNSVGYRLLTAYHSDERRPVRAGQLVAVRRVVFYADQKAAATARRAKATVRKLKRNNINVLSK